MVGYIVAIISSVLTIFSVFKERNLFNPLTVFCGIWTIIVSLSLLKIYKLHTVSTKTYLIIGLGVLCFTVGVFFSYILPRTTKCNQKVQFGINEKKILKIIYVILVYRVIKYIKVLTLLSSGYTMNVIRTSYSELVISSVIESALDSFVIQPLMIILPPIIILNFYYKKNYKLLFLLVIVIVLQTLTTGGRIIFLYLVVYFIVIGLILKKDIYIPKKIKRLIVIITCVSLGVIVLVTNMRGVDASIIEHLYLYIAACIPHLDLRIEQMELLQSQTYGFTFLSGYIQPAFYLIKNILGVPYPDFYLDFLNMANVENFINIGNGKVFNAFVTPFFYFYLDGRFLGVGLYSCIYGIFSGLIYKNMMVNKNYLTITIYMLLIFGFITSSVRWQFISPPYALAFVYVFLIFKNKSVRIKL